MSQSDAQKSGQESDGRVERPGRFRSALSVLRGQSVVPDQIVAEWVEYQQTFNRLLERFSALLARQAKAEKKRIERLAEMVDPSALEHQAPADRKADLRRRAAQLRGLPTSPRVQGSLALHVDPDDEEDENP